MSDILSAVFGILSDVRIAHDSDGTPDPDEFVVRRSLIEELRKAYQREKPDGQFPKPFKPVKAKATSSVKKFEGFSYEDGRIVKVAYFDGYGFGDRMLEGVSFKAEVDDTGELKVSFTKPDGRYEKTLNQKHWLTEARKYAASNDIFSETPELGGDDLALEPHCG